MKTKITDNLKNKIIEDYRNNLSQRQISQKHNISLGSVNKILNGNHNTFSPKGRVRKDGSIYIVYIEVNSELYFKVGIATDIGKRLLSLQTGNPFEINLYYEKYFKDNVFKIEKECHKSIYSYNIRGEWFKIDMDKANEIKLYLESLNG